MLAGVCAGIAERARRRPDARPPRLRAARVRERRGHRRVRSAPGRCCRRRASRRRRAARRIVGVVLLVWSAILALRGVGLAGSLVWPLALVAARARARSGRGDVRAAASARLASRAVVLIVAGVVVFVGENTRGSATTLLAPGAVAVALLLVLAPWALPARARARRRARRADPHARSARSSPRASTTPCCRRWR